MKHGMLVFATICKSLCKFSCGSCMFGAPKFRESPMAKRRGRPPKKPLSDEDNANQDGVELQKDEDAFQDHQGKTGICGTDKLQIRSLYKGILEIIQVVILNNKRFCVGVTPKTVGLPKCGEVILSVHGSPLGVYKEYNMETIQEAEDG
ncbi:UDP-glucose pyrophosphorylase 2 [Striga asiatica]|uniref:UDP-glucose pyrophosphorylase 2 n=1 Tax=Striga asiatica TaxID=4170 RepID=A0A5A7RD37_STRAF|nr:UDP-glucose pyrophosphorylase 2 [Striga asiatica]